MDLLLNVDARDKSCAAVDAASTRIPLDQLQQLVLGNQETLTLSFCDGNGNVPAWVTDATYTLAVGLGQPNVDGAKSYASTSTFSIVGNSRVGVLDLGTTALRDALYAAITRCRDSGANFVLEVRNVSAAGAAETLGLLNVWLANRVLDASNL